MGTMIKAAFIYNNPKNLNVLGILFWIFSGFSLLDFFMYRVLKRNFQVGYFLYISLSCEAEITKLHMGILLTIMDKIIPKIIVPASIWPQQRLSSQASQKYIVPTIT